MYPSNHGPWALVRASLLRKEQVVVVVNDVHPQVGLAVEVVVLGALSQRGDVVGVGQRRRHHDHRLAVCDVSDEAVEVLVVKDHQSCHQSSSVRNAAT